MMQGRYSGIFWGKALLWLMLVMFFFTIVSRAAASFTVAKVSVESPSGRKLSYRVQVEGRIEKNQELAVLSQPDLTVEHITVNKGQRVKKGDVLAKLDRVQLKEKIAELYREKRSLESQDKTLQDNEKQAQSKQKKEIARAREDCRQVKKKKNAVLKSAEKEAQQKLREAERALEDARNVADADYGIEINQIEIENLDQQLEKLETVKQQEGRILAPEDGVVVSVLTGVGQKTTDTALFTLRDSQNRETAVISEPDLLVKNVAVDQGKNVRKGDLLAELDREQLEERIAAIGREKRALELQNKALQENKERDEKKRDRDIARAKEDYRQAQREKKEAVAEAKKEWEQEWKTAKRALEDARMPASAQEGIEENTAELEKLDGQLEKLREIEEQKGRILAPGTGVVISILTGTGQKTTDTALFTISDDSAGLKFVGEMAAEEAKYVSAGDEISLKTAGETVDDLSITSLEMGEDKESYVVTVLLPAGSFSLGGSATMVAVQESRKYQDTVPATAVRQENGICYVLLAETEDTVLGRQEIARRREVQVLESNGIYAALEPDGLMGDSRIITETDRYVGEGDRVRLQEGEGR